MFLRFFGERFFFDLVYDFYTISTNDFSSCSQRFFYDFQPPPNDFSSFFVVCVGRAEPSRADPMGNA